MRDIKLEFNIDNQWIEIDIDQNTQFIFNIQGKDYSNPTYNDVEFSNTVSLPRTNKNEQTFRLFYRLDSVGINTNIRRNFRLYISQSLYQIGYFEVIGSNKEQYNIRLYGLLGDFFLGLKEDGSNTGKVSMMLPDLYNDGYGDDFRHRITKEFVAGFWDDTKGITNDMYSYFGYIPTYQGEYENFDSSQIFQTGFESAVNPVWWLDNIRNLKYIPNRGLTEHERSDTYNPTNPGETVPIGTPRFFGEYRSYYQKPIVKFSKLLDQIKRRYLYYYGWNIILDPDFFRLDNDYYNELWCLFDNYSIEDKLEQKIPSINITFPQITSQGDNVADQFVANNSILLNTNDIYSVNYNLKYNIAATNFASMLQILSKKNNLLINLQLALYDGTNLISESNVYQDLNKDTVRNESILFGQDSFLLNRSDEDTLESIEEEWYLSCPFNFNTFGLTNPQLKITIKLNGTTYWNTANDDSVNISAALSLRPLDINTLFINENKGIRSNTRISYKDIVKENISSLDFLLSYCKMFDLRFVIDEFNKTATIMTRSKYYSNKEIVDWSNKIDRTPEFQEEYTPFQWKTGIFKYNDNNSKYEEDYLSKIKKSYGSLTIDNNNEFLKNEEELLTNFIFDNIIQAYDYSQYYYSKGMSNTYEDDKVLAHLQTKDIKKSNFGIGLLLNNSENRRTSFSYNMIITDDHPEMLEYGYCWTSLEGYYITVNKIPNFKRLVIKQISSDKLLSLNFGNPLVSYSGNNDIIESPTGTITLYERFWRSYLRDLYSYNSKIITCNILLNELDIKDILRKFVRIDNTLYIVSKITGFNYNSDINNVQVELISVQNMDNYTNINY